MRALGVSQPITVVVLAVVLTFGAALSAGEVEDQGLWEPGTATIVPGSPYPSFGCKQGWTPTNDRTACCRPGTTPRGKNDCLLISSDTEKSGAIKKRMIDPNLPGLQKIACAR
jgi:hypothetical protein